MSATFRVSIQAFAEGKVRCQGTADIRMILLDAICQKRTFDNPHGQTLDSDDVHGIVRTPHDVAWDNRNEQRTDDSLR